MRKSGEVPQKCATGIAKAGFAKRCGRWFFPVRVMMVQLERQRLPYTARKPQQIYNNMQERTKKMANLLSPTWQITPTLPSFSLHKR